MVRRAEQGLAGHQKKDETLQSQSGHADAAGGYILGVTPVVTTDPAVYGTKAEVAFSHMVLPQLGKWGVRVDGIRHAEPAGELHMNLYLPAAYDRRLREQVLGLLQAFEESFAYAISVSPALLFDDSDESL